MVSDPTSRKGGTLKVLLYKEGLDLILSTSWDVRVFRFHRSIRGKGAKMV